MGKTISDKILLDNGYTEYEQRGSDFGERFFQKKVTDKRGVKYFIDCKYYFFAINGKQSRFWDFSMQLETKNGAVEIQTVQWFNQDGIHSGNTIKDVEEYLEKIWITHDSPYYEVYPSRTGRLAK